MKNYICIFLMFWFSNLFAPNLSNCLMQKTKLNQESVMTLKEISNDSTDVQILTHYKMKKTFTKDDRRKVRRIADSLGIKTKWLYRIFYIECRGNIYATNPYTKATGLIGFLPSTAKKLGTSTDSLKTMSVSQQLNYVHKYFKLVLHGKKMKKASDAYLAIFSPNNLGQNDSTKIGGNTAHKSRVYKYNKLLDMNKDSVITIADINTFVSLL